MESIEHEEGEEEEETRSRSYAEVLKSGLCQLQPGGSLWQRNRLPTWEKRPGAETKRASNRGERGREGAAPRTSAEDPFPAVKTERRRNLNCSKRSPDEDSESDAVALIWIIGSGYIAHAKEVAYEEYGPDFGLYARVEWFGKEGMCWTDVLPCFYDELSTQSAPDVLLVHAGGNDLGHTSAHHLAEWMRSDLEKLRAQFPSMKTVFSCINERQLWPGIPADINDDRKVVNNLMKRNAAQVGATVVRHPNINFYKKQLYVDGVHFSPQGNRIFLAAIHNVLKKIIDQDFYRH